MNRAMAATTTMKHQSALHSAEAGMSSFVLPRPRPKEFALQEQPSSSGRPACRLPKKTIALVFGLGALGVVVMGILSLVEFLQSNDIQFIDDETSTLRSVVPSELASHNQPGSDCWIVFYGQVYDMTYYPRKRHPAGPSWIAPLCGTDGTQAYAEFHSESLLRSVAGDRVGLLVVEDVEGGPTIEPGAATPPIDADEAHDMMVDCTGAADCISFDELALHATEEYCWVALHGRVYDLTEYAYVHPGGAVWVTMLAGTDGTEDYQRFHSRGLLDTIGKYLVGFLEGSLVSARLENGSTDGFSILSASSSYSSDEDADCCANTPIVSPTASLTTLPSLTAPAGVESSITDNPTTAPIVNPMPAPTGSLPTPGGITLQELALHNTQDDCWLELHGNVYALQDYVHVGPGLCTVDAASGVIANQNITQSFDAAENPAHPLSFLPQIAGFRVGQLVSATVGTPGPSVLPTSAPVAAPSTTRPTMAPVEVPTFIPTTTPTQIPVANSTPYPSAKPSLVPSTSSATLSPTSSPTISTVPKPTPVIIDATTLSPTLSTTTSGIAMTEVAQHNSPEDCWVVYFDDAYNLTGFYHPGPSLCGPGMAGTNQTLGYMGAETRPVHDSALLTIHSGLKLGPVVALAEATDGSSPMSTAYPSLAPTFSPTSTPQVVEGSSPTGIGPSELERHSSNTDCWVAIHGNVYNLSTYRHPGGPVQNCGLDATRDYQGVQSPPHTIAFLSSVEQYLVGPYSSESMPSAAGATNSETSTGSGGDGSSSGITAISLSELQNHDREGDDCWAAYHGNVYDLSSYRHPGGKNLITCGLDDTARYNGDHGRVLLGSIINLLIAPLEGGSPGTGGGTSYGAGGELDASKEDSEDSEDTN